MNSPMQNVRSLVSEAEWEARVTLAAAYRLIAHFGMSDLIYNHITCHVPGAPGEFLINPYGMMYEEINASCLIKINLAGDILFNPNPTYGINPAGYVIHSAIHGARPDVDCVIHTHTRAGMAVSALACGLMPIAQTNMRFGKIAYHDYEGVAVDLDERERLVADLGSSDVMILRNHGLLTCGPSVAEAFNTMYWLENACKTQLDALACNTPLHLPPQDVIDKTAHLFEPHVRRPYGIMEWPAMLRLLDRRDTSYRD
jgi:ribulose-5-phosphate 4-epimerase/fuculose-1-phosphate aldolase